MVLVLLGVPVRAGEDRQLPEFQVTDLDGQPVAFSTLVVPGLSLVLYLSPNAAGSHASSAPFAPRIPSPAWP